MPNTQEKKTPEPMQDWATKEQMAAHFKAWQEGGREGLRKHIAEQEAKMEDK